MRTVYSPRHVRHAGNLELNDGALVPAFELPRRAEIVRARVEEVGLGPVLPPAEHDLATARRVHAADYLHFLPRAWPMWAAAGRGGTALPFVWPAPGLRADRLPADIDGLLGFYAMDAGATFVEGTWEAVKASHDVALTAAELVAGGERAAFALCRPTGHHAGRRFAPRLLLRQQRRGRRGAAARAQGGEGLDPRHRLSPRQRHRLRTGRF